MHIHAYYRRRRRPTPSEGEYYFMRDRYRIYLLDIFFFLVKSHLGIKTLPPHLPLTFARTSTIDTPHCPLDPCRLDRRNHPALDALQVHLVLFLRVSILSADDFFRG